MAKKGKRLMKNKLLISVMVLGVLSMGVICGTLIFTKCLWRAQVLQRHGYSSTEWNLKTLFSVIFLVAMIRMLFQCIYTMINEVKKRIEKRRKNYQAIFEEDREKRVLRKVLFEAIKGDLIIPDEEELWEILTQLSPRLLIEAINERSELIEEMYEKQVIGG